MSLVGTLARFFIENRARYVSYAEACQNLKNGGETAAAALRKAADTSANREQAGHVISMERWGAARLRSLLEGNGEKTDESGSYRPDAGLDMTALAQEFEKARAETLNLAARLEPQASQRARHNEFGKLSGKAWLVYLNNHANMESHDIQ